MPVLINVAAHRTSRTTVQTYSGVGGFSAGQVGVQLQLELVCNPIKSPQWPEKRDEKLHCGGGPYSQFRFADDQEFTHSVLPCASATGMFDSSHRHLRQLGSFPKDEWALNAHKNKQ